MEKGGKIIKKWAKSGCFVDFAEKGIEPHEIML